MAGIKDIAKIAGVSISTVSYALNGSSKVTEATRQRITAIANELNYVPNMAARTLKRKQTSIIGVYLADYGGSFYGDLLQGIKQGLDQKGYEMIVCSGQKSHLFIPEKMIDGAIILDWTFKTDEIKKYADRGHRLLVLDRQTTHKNIRQLLLDNDEGAALAIKQMIHSGTKNVFLVTGPAGYDSEHRLKSSKKILDENKIPYQIIQGGFIEDSGYEAAREIMTYSSDYPIDIFSFNDEMAIGMYKYFEEKNIDIGTRVRIIGFDNIELGRFLRPTLATIDYSKKEWGVQAANKIVALINEEEVSSGKIATQFISGGSFV